VHAISWLSLSVYSLPQPLLVQTSTEADIMSRMEEKKFESIRAVSLPENHEFINEEKSIICLDHFLRQISQWNV